MRQGCSRRCSLPASRSGGARDDFGLVAGAAQHGEQALGDRLVGDGAVEGVEQHAAIRLTVEEALDFHRIRNPGADLRHEGGQGGKGSILCHVLDLLWLCRAPLGSGGIASPYKRLRTVTVPPRFEFFVFFRAGARLQAADRAWRQRSRSVDCYIPIHTAPPAQPTCVSSGLPAKWALRLSTTSWPMAARVAWVALPICGSSTTFSIAKSASGTRGASAKTSSPAPPSLPSCSAFTSAGSSITEPRAMLITPPLVPSAARTSALTRLRVAPPPGHLTLRYCTTCAI